LKDLDEALLQKIKAGDLGSFETLVFRYQRKIFAFIYRMVMSEEDARGTGWRRSFFTIKTCRISRSPKLWVFR